MLWLYLFIIVNYAFSCDSAQKIVQKKVLMKIYISFLLFLAVTVYHK